VAEAYKVLAELVERHEKMNQTLMLDLAEILRYFHVI
jgi:hypothetical protein